MANNAYQRFLIRHRVYCELCAAPIPATRVARIRFKDTCICDAHAAALFPIEYGLKLRKQLEGSR